MAGFVLNQTRLRRMEEFDFLLEPGQEMGGTSANQVGNTITDEELAAVTRRIHSTDQPLFISNQYPRTGRRNPFQRHTPCSRCAETNASNVTIPTGTFPRA